MPSFLAHSLRRITKLGGITLAILMIWWASPITMETATAQTPAASAAKAGEGLVVLLYHRFGEDRYPTTSVKTESFRRQMEFLSRPPFSIMPLMEALKRIENGDPLPPYTVAITVDDGFRSYYDVAYPILSELNIPSTIFISLGSSGAAFINNSELRTLSQDPRVTVALSGYDHKSLTSMTPADVQQQIEQSQALYRSVLGQEPPSVFAYPFGQTSQAVMKIVQQLGFRYAFGQHSDLVTRNRNFLFFGRFSMSDSIQEDLAERTTLVTQSLPLEVFGIEPQNPFLAKFPDTITFRAWSPYGQMQQNNFNCFVNGKRAVTHIEQPREKMPVRPPRKDSVKAELESLPLVQVRIRNVNKDTIRLNCTYPSIEEGPLGTRFLWFGTSFYRPTDK